MRHLLIVEDDPFLRNITNEHLLGMGYHVEMAINLQMAKEVYQNNIFDMILLDLTLPDGNGFDWAKELSKNPSKPPIIFLTSHTDITDVKKGFELGGSDYIKKPFDMEELTIRIKHILKDFNTGSGQEIHLGQLQGAVLNELSEQIGKVVSKEFLLNKYWGEANYFTSRNLDSAIVKLRAQFKNDTRVLIAALKRKGYQLLIHDNPIH